MFWRSSYVEGFLVPIFHLMIYLELFFEVNLRKASFDFTDGIVVGQ